MTRREPGEPYPSHTTMPSPTVEQKHQERFDRKLGQDRGNGAAAKEALPPTVANDYRD